jgi:hypothetical protein
MAEQRFKVRLTRINKSSFAGTAFKNEEPHIALLQWRGGDADALMTAVIELTRLTGRAIGNHVKAMSSIRSTGAYTFPDYFVADDLKAFGFDAV